MRAFLSPGLGSPSGRVEPTEVPMRPIETTRIKLLSPILFNDTYQVGGDVLEVEAPRASELIRGGYAVAHAGPEAPPEPEPVADPVVDQVAPEANPDAPEAAPEAAPAPRRVRPRRAQSGGT